MPISLIGWFGVLLGFSSLFLLSGRKWHWDKLGFVFFLAVIQTAVAVYFYFYALENDTDAGLYYYDRYNFFDNGGFGLSTQFVIWLVQSLKGMFGGSYLDYFLLFQATGTWGAVYILRSYRDIFAHAQTQLPNMLLLTLLLPGIHFWTAFIGKDGPLFLGASLLVWASINLRKRWIIAGLGVTVMMLFRPHIALVAVTALMAALFFDRRTKPTIRMALGVLAAIGFVIAAMTVRSTFGVDISNVDAVSDYITRTSKISDVMEGSTNVSGASFPVKLFSLMFRPLFFDSGGSLPSLIASVENALLLLFFGYVLWRRKLLSLLVRRIFYVRFAVVYTIMITVLLAMIYYNVGLGLRQKTMVMPALFAILAAMVAAERVRRPEKKRRGRPVPA